MACDISENNRLLSQLIEDHKVAVSPWAITAYWDTYNKRILREVGNSGISNLQANFLLLKGFARGGVPQVIPPKHILKRIIFNGVQAIPPFDKVVFEYQRLIRTLHKRNVELRISHSKEILKQIEAENGKINFEFDVDNGHAEDVFDWNGHKITTSIVPYLARCVDFYNIVDKREVRSLLEIGPGLGWSTLSHVILNPYIKKFVNIDIPATLYLSTQFLRSFDALEVTDYVEFQNNNNAVLDHKSSRPTCLCLPTWCVEKISDQIDWFHNAYSFQEMEPEVVQAYLGIANKFVTNGYWIMSSIYGHLPNAGGQKRTVDIDMISKCLPNKFKHLKSPIQHSANFGESFETYRIYSL